MEWRKRVESVIMVDISTTKSPLFLCPNANGRRRRIRKYTIRHLMTLLDDADCRRRPNVRVVVARTETHSCNQPSNGLWQIQTIITISPLEIVRRETSVEQMRQRGMGAESILSMISFVVILGVHFGTLDSGLEINGRYLHINSFTLRIQCVSIKLHVI